MTRYVQSKYSKDAKKWEVRLDREKLWCCALEVDVDGVNYTVDLPKSEYIECPPPAVDVTGECTVWMNGRAIRHMTGFGVCNYDVWDIVMQDCSYNKGYRFALIDGQLRVMKEGG